MVDIRWISVYQWWTCFIARKGPKQDQKITPDLLQSL